MSSAHASHSRLEFVRGFNYMVSIPTRGRLCIHSLRVVYAVFAHRIGWVGYIRLTKLNDAYFERLDFVYTRAQNIIELFAVCVCVCVG